MTVPVTVPEIRARKRSRGADPIVMITAYDAPFARVVDAAGVDIILVGDTLAEVVLGRGTPSTWESRILPTTWRRWPAPDRGRCSSATCPGSPTTSRRATRSATRRCSSEPGPKRSSSRAGVAVWPRSGRSSTPRYPSWATSGSRPSRSMPWVATRSKAARRSPPASCARTPRRFVGSGMFRHRARGRARRPGRARSPPRSTSRRSASGPGRPATGRSSSCTTCSGLAEGDPARFVRRYAELGSAATKAVRDWAADVRAGRYPSEAESYHASAELRASLGLSGR